MKKCPTCSKTFEDTMRFCQVDGTPLVDDVPAFDPYATIVAQPRSTIEPPPAAFETPAPVVAPPAPVIETPPPVIEAAAPEYHPIVEEPVVETLPASEAAADPVIHQTISSVPIHEPDDVLDLPSADLLKTMYVSDAEMQAALGGQEAAPEFIDIPPIEETPDAAPPSVPSRSPET